MGVYPFPFFRYVEKHTKVLYGNFGGNVKSESHFIIIVQIWDFYPCLLTPPYPAFRRGIVQACQPFYKFGRPTRASVGKGFASAKVSKIPAHIRPTVVSAHHAPIVAIFAHNRVADNVGAIGDVASIFQAGCRAFITVFGCIVLTTFARASRSENTYKQYGE